jgi:hypothetical protein
VFVAAAVMAAVAIWVAASLPPARRSPDSQAKADRAIPGVLHVHTNRSDGRSAPDEIARIAARSGLKFVIFTDHGDATRRPDPPAYRAGVLCLDGVEISTDAGHLLALGLPAAPYPLAGEARDVIEDVHRLGGIAIAAHPDSPKLDLQWRDWAVPLDGVEVINLDTLWRVHVSAGTWASRYRLFSAVMTYPVRPAETIASLLTERPALVAQWSALSRTRRVPMFAGLDAHARLGWGDAETAGRGFALTLPSYEALFRTLTMRVTLANDLSGDAAADARQLLDALRAGHAYAAVDAISDLPAFEWTAAASGTIAQGGDVVPAQEGATLTIRTNASPSFTTTVWRDDQILISRSAAPLLTLTAAPEPAVYRVDIRATDRPGTPVWILSNPIFVRAAQPPTPAMAGQAGPSRARRVLLDGGTTADWRTEAAAESKIAIELAMAVEGREIRVRYGLPGGDASDQFAAFVADVNGGIASQQRLRFTARSAAPMRLSVQLRASTVAGSERWQRSIYLAQDAQTYSLPLDDFRPIGATSTPRAPLAAVQTIIFAVDQTNSKPGASGQVWMRDVALE